MMPRAFLETLFNTAVAAAHPASCLPPHLPPPPANGRLILLAAGKAAGAMIEAAERYYLDELKFVNIIGQQANFDALKNNTLQGTLLREPAVLAQAKDAGFTGLEAAQSAGNTMTMNNGVKVTCTGGQPARVAGRQPGRISERRLHESSVHSERL